MKQEMFCVLNQVEFDSYELILFMNHSKITLFQFTADQSWVCIVIQISSDVFLKHKYQCDMIHKQVPQMNWFYWWITQNCLNHLNKILSWIHPALNHLNHKSFLVLFFSARDSCHYPAFTVKEWRLLFNQVIGWNYPLNHSKDGSNSLETDLRSHLKQWLTRGT